MSIKNDAGMGRQVSATRRRAIGAGTLAAIVAGLLGTGGTSQAGPSLTPIVGTVTNVADLVAEVKGYVEAGNAAWETQDRAQDDLYEVLPPE